MSSIDSFTAALDGLKQGYEAGRLAHAYIIVGSPRGNASEFVESFIQFLFCREKQRPCGTCAECRRVQGHVHPDVIWFGPESKARRILIGDNDEEGIRKVNRFVSLSPYSGQRKVAVILEADRMNDAAANDVALRELGHLLVIDPQQLVHANAFQLVFGLLLILGLIIRRHGTENLLEYSRSGIFARGFGER